MDFMWDVLEEIALEGLDGITLDGLWLRLSQRPSFCLPLDDNTKAFLWRNIARHPELEFFELPVPRDELRPYNRFDFLDADTGFWIDCQMIPPDIYPIHIVKSTSDNIQGSCQAYQVRENLTSTLCTDTGDLAVNLEEALERWGSKLVVVASQDMRTRALVGKEYIPSIQLDDMKYCILERIGRARTDGVTTAGNMSLDVFKLQPKTLFYHCKVLQKHCLCKKQFFVAKSQPGKNVHCRLFHLSRLFTPIKSKYMLLCDLVCNYLAKKPNKRDEYSAVKQYLDIDEIMFKRLLANNKKYFVAEDVMYRDMFPDAPASEYLTKSLVKEKRCRILKLIRHPDDDEDEVDEEEEDVVSSASILDSNWVFGQSLMQQCWHLFDNAGPNGLVQNDVGRKLNLARLEARCLCKYLLKRNYIVSVLKDFGKQKVTVFIGKKFESQSGITQKLTAERNKMKEHLMKNGTELDQSTLSSQGDTADMSATVNLVDTINSFLESSAQEANSQVEDVSRDSGTPSLTKETDELPLVADDIKDNSETAPSTPSLLEAMPKVTARMLARANRVIEFVHKVKVQQRLGIQKHIIEAEQNQYRDKMDKRTLNRILDWLKREGKIKVVKTLVQTDQGVEEFEFVCDPNLESDSPLLKTNIEQQKMRRFGIKKETIRKGLSFDFTSSSFGSEPDAAVLSSRMAFRMLGTRAMPEMKHDPLQAKRYCLLPKFRKAQRVHELLFFLLYGTPDSTRMPEQYQVTDYEDFSDGTEKTIYDQINELAEPPVYHEEYDDWRRYLAPLPIHKDQPCGWCVISDVLFLLPLSVFCNIVRLPYDIKGLPELLEHPVMKYYPVNCLPFRLIQQLLHARRYIYSFYDACMLLCHMGLLSFGPQNGMEKDKAHVYLHTKAEIWDTRTSKPGYMKTVAPEDSVFPCRYYEFLSEEDVRTFWSDVVMVSLSTNLDCKREIDSDEFDGEVMLRDVQAQKPMVDNLSYIILPGDRRGAAGFDSALYCHLVRNWFKPNDKLKTKQEIEDRTMKLSRKSVSLKNKEERLARNLARKMLSVAGGKKEMVKVIEMKNVKLSKGGKGIKRKKPVSVGLPFASQLPKKAASSITRRYFKKKPIRKRVYDQVDEGALKMMIMERVNWTSEEDVVLLLCKVASMVMNKERIGVLVPWTVVRDFLYKHCPGESRDKTSMACQRRVNHALKQTQTKLNVSLFYTEAMHDQNIQNEVGKRVFNTTDPDVEEKFIRISELLVQKVRSSNWKQCSLPSSLEELYERFHINVVPAHLTEKFELEDVRNNDDILRSVIRNITLSFLCAANDKQGRSHEMYKLLCQYPDSLLHEIYEKMNKEGTITRKKRDQHHKLKTQSLSYIRQQLSQRFFYTFHSRMPSEVFPESHMILEELWRNHIESEGMDRVHQKDGVLAGSNATVIALLALRKISFEIKIPKDIVTLDSKGLTMPHGRGISGREPLQSENEDDDMPASDREQMTARQKPVAAVRKSSQTPAGRGDTWTSTTHRVTDISMEVDENIGDPSNIAVKMVITNDGHQAASRVQVNNSVMQFQEEDDFSDKQKLPQIPANTRSRSMLSLARTKMMSLVDVKSNAIQDHFVINIANAAISLMPSVVVADIWPLFVSEEKCKDIIKRQQRRYPCFVNLMEAWQALDKKNRKEDMRVMRVIHRDVDESGMLGLKDHDLQKKFCSVPNLSVLLKQLDDSLIKVTRHPKAWFSGEEMKKMDFHTPARPLIGRQQDIIFLFSR